MSHLTSSMKQSIICNAKLEHLFSKLKYVKPDFRASLSAERLENILRIIEDGPPNQQIRLIGSFCGYKTRSDVQFRLKKSLTNHIG